jgi:hypothetical protein
MMPTFEMAADGGEAIQRIIGYLTMPQRRALRLSVQAASEQTRWVTLVSAGEHTVRALKSTPAPLVEQQGMIRYLTPLGVDVGRFLLAHDGPDRAPRPGRPEFTEPQ